MDNVYAGNWIKSAHALTDHAQRGTAYRRVVAARYAALEDALNAAEEAKSFAPVEDLLKTPDFTFKASTSSFQKGYGAVEPEAATVNALWLGADAARETAFRDNFAACVLEKTGAALASWMPTATALETHRNNGLSAGAHSYFTFVAHIRPALKRLGDTNDPIFTGLNGAEHSLAEKITGAIIPRENVTRMVRHPYGKHF